MRSYRDLEVWRLAMELAVECYDVTRGFPREERYGVVAQIRQSAVSVPANIAEGQARFHPRDFRRFLQIARGSLAELVTYLEFALRVGWLKEDVAGQLLERAARVGRMINGLRASLRVD